MIALRRAIDVLLVAWLAAILAVALAHHLAPASGARVLAIGAGSVGPATPIGSLVLAVERDPSAIVVGDRVALHLPASTIATHWISGIVEHGDERWFETGGGRDAALIAADRIFGRIEVVVPLAGHLLTMLSSPLGTVALLSIAAALWLAAWLIEDGIRSRTRVHRPPSRIRIERLSGAPGSATRPRRHDRAIRALDQARGRAPR